MDEEVNRGENGEADGMNLEVDFFFLFVPIGIVIELNMLTTTAGTN